MHQMKEAEEKLEDEYKELSEEKNAKYTQVPKDALLEEKLKLLCQLVYQMEGEYLLNLETLQ